MTILFLCRWKLTDVLTASTVMPHLCTLVEFEWVESIIFSTLEDHNPGLPEGLGLDAVLKHQKVHWEPMIAFSGAYKMMNQIADMLLHVHRLTSVIKERNVQTIIAHGAPAGALAYKVWQRLRVHFYVSLFEPHADYMLESGVWKKSGLKYRFQKRWEEQQKKNAAGLMPVANNFASRLIQDGVPSEKVYTVSCSVKADLFKFDLLQREKVRGRLKWQERVIGIYVGKYGGLYYEAEAFAVYKTCFERVPGFRLLILSPQPKNEILEMLQQHQIEAEKVYVASVPHQEVPVYLSAADFAFATYKPGLSKKYLSPVKVGEYWANGLPVLLTEGVGDDSDIIRNEGGGATFNLQKKGSVRNALAQIQQILKDPNHREEIPNLARKYRSSEQIREAYEYFFGQRQEEQP